MGKGNRNILQCTWLADEYIAVDQREGKLVRLSVPEGALGEKKNVHWPSIPSWNSFNAAVD